MLSKVEQLGWTQRGKLAQVMQSLVCHSKGFKQGSDFSKLAFFRNHQCCMLWSACVCSPKIHALKLYSLTEPNHAGTLPPAFRMWEIYFWCLNYQNVWHSVTAAWAETLCHGKGNRGERINKMSQGETVVGWTRELAMRMEKSGWFRTYLRGI